MRRKSSGACSYEDVCELSLGSASSQSDNPLFIAATLTASRALAPLRTRPGAPNRLPEVEPVRSGWNIWRRRDVIK